MPKRKGEWFLVPIAVLALSFIAGVCSVAYRPFETSAEATTQESGESTFVVFQDGYCGP